MSESVAARVRYLNPDWRGRSERPRVSSRDTRRANTRFYQVQIEDARPLQERGELDLDTNGFVLVPHRTRVKDFRDPAQITIDDLLKSPEETIAEYEAILAQMRDLSEQEMMDQVYRKMTLMLCRACYEGWIEKPVG